jgi:hypothetical protein
VDEHGDPRAYEHEQHSHGHEPLIRRETDEDLLRRDVG